MYYICNVSCNECLSEIMIEKIGYKNLLNDELSIVDPLIGSAKGQPSPGQHTEKLGNWFLDNQIKQQIFHEISEPEQLLVTIAILKIFCQIFLRYLGNKYPKHGLYENTFAMLLGAQRRRVWSDDGLEVTLLGWPAPFYKGLAQLEKLQTEGER